MAYPYSYFDPTTQLTPNSEAAVADGPPLADPVFTAGLAKADIAVACDLSHIVYGFIGGVKAWQRAYTNAWVRALDTFKGTLWVGNGTNIDVLVPKTGDLIRTLAVPNAPAPITTLRITNYLGVDYVTVCFENAGPGSVRIYAIGGASSCGWSLTQFYVNPHPASNPRGAYYDTRWLWVSDTFYQPVPGQYGRVYAVDTLNGAMRPGNGAFFEVYFPNMIEFVPGSPDKVIIAAEHENRILQIDYEPTVTREILASAPVAPFNDSSKTKAQIISGQAATQDITSIYTPKRSKCAVEYSGRNTLYSPNDVRRAANGDLLVADTDNHRVVLWSGGVVAMELTGFNDPVGIAFI